jgi:hypothetical protein
MTIILVFKGRLAGHFNYIPAVNATETLENEKNLVYSNIAGKRCYLRCKKPQGTLIGAMVAAIIGFIFVPLLAGILEGTVPLTIDGIGNGIMDELMTVLTYDGYFPSVLKMIIYFLSSMIAGMIAIKLWKALLIPVISFVIILLVFFFLALFFGAIPFIDYWLLFVGIAMNSWLIVVILSLVPSISGWTFMKIQHEKKKCFVMNESKVAS